MDSGQFVYTISRLSLGALAAFFAILLWTKTRDAAWMLVVAGVITAYAETVYSVLTLLGFTGINRLSTGSMPFMSILLPCLPPVFFIAAFAVMVFKKYQRH